MEYTVYATIKPPSWSLFFMYKNVPIHAKGEDTHTRNELQSISEILCFLRKWFLDPATFNININSQYCITCIDQWNPQWIQNGFLISKL